MTFNTSWQDGLSAKLDQIPNLFQWQRSDLKLSAVLVLIYQRDGQEYILLGKKSDNLKQHKGQISLPGGGQNKSDPSLKYTALRELEEEFAVSDNDVEFLGYLSSIWTLTRYLIYPAVAILNKKDPNFIMDQGEFQNTIEFPFKLLWDDSIFKKYQAHYMGKTYQMEEFNYQDEKIWGATAKILTEFKDRLEINPYKST